MLEGRKAEGLLADVLDGLIGRARRSQGTCEDIRVGELPRERDVEALDVDEPTCPEQALAGARPPEGHHRRLVLNFVRRG